MSMPGPSLAEHRDAEGLARIIDTELRVQAEHVRHWDPIRDYQGEPYESGDRVCVATGGAAFLRARLREYDRATDQWTAVIDTVTLPTAMARECSHDAWWVDVTGIDSACHEHLCNACRTRRWSSRRESS